MPIIVGGKRFHQHNLPGPKLPPENHHVAQSPVTVTTDAASEAAARYKAEHMLAISVGTAEEIIITEIIFSPARFGVACKLTGIPIKYTTA